MNSGPDPLRPSGRAPPSAPEPRSPTAAPVATGFSQTGRSPSEEKFPQWPRAAGKYSLSPLVGQSESAAERNTSPHSEVGDPPPEPDFIPFIWDEIPFSQKKKKKEKKKKGKSLQLSPHSRPKTRAQATILGKRRGQGGWRGAAPQRRQQRPTGRRSREAGARRGGLSVSSASICKPRDAEEGGKLYRKRSKAQIAAGGDKRPRSPEGTTTRAYAAGEPDAVGETGPKSRARARPARGRNAEWK